MAIDYFHFLADDGWNDLALDTDNKTQLWDKGGTLADAPVDVKKTFTGKIWVKPQLDPTFHLQGTRLAPGFVMPPRRHDEGQLVLVLGGELTVSSGENAESTTVLPGHFWVCEAQTPFTVTAGTEGVTYVETWPTAASDVTTWWYDEGWVAR